MSDDRNRKKPPRQNYIAIGLAIGIAVGAALDNIALGIAMGVVFGAAMSRRGPKNDD